jgi:hypothetical protein
MLQRIYNVPAMSLETIETPALLLDADKLEERTAVCASASSRTASCCVT